MERIYKLLQITALAVALLAPPIYFVGYAYDWGYLDSFAIEHQMFFKAPQEYLGHAIVVIFLVGAKLFQYVFAEHIFITLSTLAILAVAIFSHRYLVRQPRLWSRIYLRWSNWIERIRRRISVRLVESVASAYLFTALPVLILAGSAYLLLLVVSPGLIGYSNGQEAAAKLKAEWKPETCTPKKMIGCTQILQAGKLVAAGKLIVASEKQAAIFDGYSVQIYSLNNRDIKTIL